MTAGGWPDAAVGHLRSHRVVFEPGLGDEEVARVEGEHRFRFPPDLRRFLQTALPVTAGFPNWRSESVSDLRRCHLDPPVKGILFDTEHNGFWLSEWGARPADLADAIAEAGRRLAGVPPLVPVRSHHYLPSGPDGEGSPVLSVRQTDIACVGRDLPTYLTTLFDPGRPVAEAASVRAVPFWTAAARMSTVRVPDLAGPAVGGTGPEYDHLCRAARAAGFWAGVIPLLHGHGVTFDRAEPARGRKSGVFWATRRAFGWLVCVRSGPWFYAPDAARVPDLCLALARDLTHQEPDVGKPVAQSPRPADRLRREFGLVAIPPATQWGDERERDLRAWERAGWRQMSQGQRDEAWAGYDAGLCDPPGGPFRPPTPSATWDVAHAYLRGKEFTERAAADLTRAALAALQVCTQPGEELLALDVNHDCYFFDLHAAAAAGPHPWPVPVLPDGNYCLLLAPDHRFGIVGDCGNLTVSVFGADLLAALGRSPPLAFTTPTRSSEERRVGQARWAALGWRRLDTDEKDDIWDRFDARFGFSRGTAEPGGPAIAEPAPSVTWAAGPAAGGDQAAADLTRAVVRGLRAVAGPGERLYALSYPRWYENYTFEPHRLGPADRDAWAVPIYSADDFTFILAPDFRFGVVGDPVEGTVCLFGGELLAAAWEGVSGEFGRVVRQNPEPADRQG